MCGIFGGVIGSASGLRERARLQSSIERLFKLSESRGKEAAGLALASQEQLLVYKAAVPARVMIKTPAYRSLVREIAGAQRSRGVAFIGHSRLVTDGVREQNRNNQPVISRGIVGIHNGIIVNHAELWRRHAQLTRQYEVDSEVIFALIGAELERGLPISEAAQRTFAALTGAASIAALFEDRDALLLGTNNGSLYYRAAPNAFVFASESYIVDQFAARHAAELGLSETLHLEPGQAALVELETLAVQRFSLIRADAERHRESVSVPVRAVRRQLVDRAALDSAPAPPPRSAARLDFTRLEQQFPYVSMRDRLQRCTRCVLPETMPFVDFDQDGVCAYCRAHQPIVVRGREALEQLVGPHRRRDGRPDCIVGVSGGRDSIFGLHYLKTVMGLNPVAYTYDWGMVTDLARRNTSRICGQLGIEHILISADIPKKRDYIRANVDAWLARPLLGTIPLFMAGDKAYFYYLNRARQQLGVKLAFLCENLLERTDFKTGFAGVSPVVHDRDHVYTMPGRNKFDLARFYAKEFLKNPRYLNSSLLDTGKAFAYYYLIKRDYHNLYSYIEWNEPAIATTLLGDYGFERAEDTESLWRIGDGTAAFYNYIYHAIAGMTENDTFRSNQIRNGAIARGAALDLIERDNRPRFPSIQWYLQTIGLDRSVQEVLELIERTPKRHARSAA
jgi:predicted glutamine amidotransferase